MWAMSQSCVDKIMSVQKISKIGQKLINLAHITSVSLLVMGICGKITVIKNYS
jgi:hypothetical protein